MERYQIRSKLDIEMADLVTWMPGKQNPDCYEVLVFLFL